MATLVFAISNGNCRIIPRVTRIYQLFDDLCWRSESRHGERPNSASSAYLVERYFAVYALMTLEEGAVWGVDHIKWFVYDHKPVAHLMQSEMNKILITPFEENFYV